MPSKTKCCGTCRWFDARGATIGKCRYPLLAAAGHVKTVLLNAIPSSCSDAINGIVIRMHGMLSTEGKRCPCYERKDHAE